MRLLAAILEPTAGDAWVAGRHIVREAEAVKDDIGYMSQRFGLYPDLTVMENIDFYADIYDVPRARRASEKIDRLLAFSNLTPFKQRLAGNLSGGMKQKLGLACALIHTPQGALPRRADQRRRSRLAPRFLADPLPAAAGEGDDLRLHGLPRRGRALQPRRPDPPGAAAGLRHARPRCKHADAGHDPGDPHRAQPRQAAALLRERLPGASVGPVRRPGARGQRATADAEPAAGRGCCRPAGIALLGIRPIEPSLEDVFVSVLGSRAGRAWRDASTAQLTPQFAVARATTWKSASATSWPSNRVSFEVARGRDLRLPRARTAPASRPPSACSAASSRPAAGTRHGGRLRHPHPARADQGATSAT